MKNYINNISDFDFIKYTLATVIFLQFSTVFVLKSYTSTIFFLSILALVFILIMFLKTEKQDKTKEKITEDDESEFFEEE